MSFAPQVLLSISIVRQINEPRGQLFGNSSAATKCCAFLIATSATGSLIAIIYTFSRGRWGPRVPRRLWSVILTIPISVKQSIGVARILPWSSLWRQDSPETRGANNDSEKTPMGGLVLHWLSTVTMIAATARVRNTIDRVTFPGTLQAYAHCVVIGKSLQLENSS